MVIARTTVTIRLLFVCFYRKEVNMGFYQRGEKFLNVSPKNPSDKPTLKFTEPSCLFLFVSLPGVVLTSL